MKTPCAPNVAKNPAFGAGQTPLRAGARLARAQTDQEQQQIGKIQDHQGHPRICPQRRHQQHKAQHNVTGRIGAKGNFLKLGVGKRPTINAPTKASQTAIGQVTGGVSAPVA